MSAVLLAAPPAPSPSAPSPAVSSRTIVGEIVSVDVATRQVVVRESVKKTKVKGQAARPETVTMTLDPAAPVQRGKRPVPLAELKPKDHVVARYLVTPGGARAIWLRVADVATAEPTTAAPTPGGGSAGASTN